jgi:hypothetical protein
LRAFSTRFLLEALWRPILSDACSDGWIFWTILFWNERKHETRATTALLET